jgi:serine phosphatase RsbU (regulator of sigma subunit)
MKNKLSKILCIYFFLCLGIFPDSKTISLTEDCESALVEGSSTSTCKPRTWYLKDDFTEAYLSESLLLNEAWKKVTTFPIRVNTYYLHKENLRTYTFLTYFDLPENFQLQRQTGVIFGEIGEVFEIYLNGKLIAQDGKIENNKIKIRRTVRGQVYEFDKNLLIKKNNQLLIKISGDPKYDHTGFYLTKSYKIGAFENLQYEEQDRISLILIGIYLFVGIYHVFLFLKRKKEKSNLYYGLFTICLGTYLYTRSTAIFENSWDSGIIQKVELCVLYPMVMILSFLLEELYFEKIRKISSQLMVFCLVLSSITVFVPFYFAEYILKLWQIFFLVFGIGLYINILYLGIKNKIPNARRLLIGLVLVIVSSIYDILDSLIFNSGLSFTKYTFFMFVFGFATVLANKFISVHSEIEELNESLERRVEIRTKELTDSLHKVNELKKQQDGDYYLTSLLIEPLGMNNSDKENISIQFLIEQKKKFNFKGINSEIGGDLCRTENIELKGNNFIVFFNSDAMGKSIQGAGGAIVMGAVFDSILERTNLNRNNGDMYPERWLKNSFIELHKVFESFDCSMLVSVILGLIDNSTGLIYFISAEHPNPVLYRDGKASFIPVERMYRKLGMPIHDSELVMIETFQMKFGDVIIFGSDGRDDIMMPNKENEAELNIDENLFLKFVEMGRGSIQDVTLAIKEIAVLTDDLSLLSMYLNHEIVKYGNETYDEILNFGEPEMISILQSNSFKLSDYLENKNLSLYETKILILALHYLRKFTELVGYAKEYLRKVPSDNFIFYIYSRSLREIKNFDLSIEIGERLRLRGEFTEKNILNLAMSYIDIGNTERARYLLKKTSDQFPDNEQIRIFLQKLK